jgi:hypothetical protein
MLFTVCGPKEGETAIRKFARWFRALRNRIGSAAGLGIRISSSTDVCSHILGNDMVDHAEFEPKTLNVHGVFS